MNKIKKLYKYLRFWHWMMVVHTGMYLSGWGTCNEAIIAIIIFLTWDYLERICEQLETYNRVDYLRAELRGLITDMKISKTREV